MTESSGQRPNASAETYTFRASSDFEAQMAQRTVLREAAFFVPHLSQGMSVVDVGCGPGSLTLGLAEVVAPGQVVGVDIQPEQISKARAAATERGISNVRFEAGDCYQLPFPDDSFDAAFCHGVLMHLTNPVRALTEIRRVLSPNGIVGVRDNDYGGYVSAPSSPLMEEAFALAARVRERNGGNPFLGRNHRRLLLDAGFARTYATASVNTAGSLEETRAGAAFLRSQRKALEEVILSEGWADQDKLDAIAAEVDERAERPDTFSLVLWCEAIGWVS